MATETTNLKLSKPEATDFYDIAVQNENMDKIDEAITGKANKTDIPNIPSSLPANGGNADTVGGKLPSAFANASHTHDDRYYTESEIDVKIGAKANSSHTHYKSQITDFPSSLPANGGNANTVGGIGIDLGTHNTYGLRPIAMDIFSLQEGVSEMTPGQIYIMYE